MDLATGAMGSLLPKLATLLKDEYDLQKGVKEGVKSLEKEMKSMLVALSFDMEDIVDKFLVHVDDDSATKSNKLKQLVEKMAGLFTKVRARHEIADAIKEINKQVEEVAKRRERYNVDNIVPMPAAMSTIDPRLGALYEEVTELVGIAGERDDELMKLLSDGDSVTKNKLRIVSVVGFGGLGKTTLVKTVYDKIKEDFKYMAFVPVGRNADAKKILMDILLDFGVYKSHFNMLDERQLIDKLQECLKNKRFHFILLIIRIETGEIEIMDSLRRKPDEYKSVRYMLKRVWKQFITEERGEWKDKLDFKANNWCMRQPKGTDLCGYYVLRVHSHEVQ